MKTQRAYHTDVKLQYQLGLLPAHVCRQIPSSTRHYWARQDYSLLFGHRHALFSEENMEMIRDFLTHKRLLQAARALWHINRVLLMIVAAFKNKRRLPDNVRAMVIRVVERLNPVFMLTRICKHLGISSQQYYYWVSQRRKCRASLAGLCRNRHPHQLTRQEVQAIRSALKAEQTKYWNLVSAYYYIMRQGKAYMAKSTFYHYVRWLGYTKPVPKFKPQHEGLRADAPGQVLHMDVTLFRPLDRSRVYIYLVVDNYSRLILHWMTSLEYSARKCFENLEAALRKHGLQRSDGVDLIVDDGPENKAEVNELARAHGLRKKVAQADISPSNSMVESVIRTLKHDYLYRKPLADHAATDQFLAFAVKDLTQRPRGALCGYTSHEVYKGALPDEHRYKKEMQTARRERTRANRAFNCQKHCNP